MSWQQRSLTRIAIRGARFVSSTRYAAPKTKFWAKIGTAGAVGVGLALWSTRDTPTSPIAPQFLVYAATQPIPQENVYSDTKEHALYLWIHLTPKADVQQCAKTVQNLQSLVDEVSPPDLRDEHDEIWAGVGFGEDALKKIGKRPPQAFAFVTRKGPLGELPNTDGDIFIHAKSNSMGKLFELSQKLQEKLPRDSVESFQDVYSFVYRNGRDLSGFIDGTENSADEDSRFNVAVNKSTGGSFCITQKWIHQHDVIKEQKDSTLEGWVGRGLEDSTELSKKSATSHVARMTTGPALKAKKEVEIVRQSMPFGTVSGDSGLFFIGFAESPANFDYMLDRMTGAASDGLSDDIMRLSRCVQGNYWYFPSKEELKKLV